MDQPLRRDRRRRRRCRARATAMLLARGGLRVLVIEAARHGHRHPVHACAHARRRAATAPLGAARRGRRRRHPGHSLRPSSLTATRSRRSTSARATASPRCAPRAEPSSTRCCWRRPAPPAPRSACPARVTRLLTDGGRVRGVEGITRGTGTPFRATATLTVGADGRNSTVAQAVDADFRRRGTASGAIVYGYFPGLPRDRYHWAYRPGVTAGVVPTGDGLACVWAGTAGARFARQRSASLDDHLPVTARRGRRRSWPRRSAPHRPSARSAPSPAAPGCDPRLRAARAGRWSATPPTSRTPSPRTASPTPCATRSCSPARCSTHPAAGGPSSTPCATTNTPATGSPSRCSTSPSASRATSGTSRSCARTFAR